MLGNKFYFLGIIFDTALKYAPLLNYVAAIIGLLWAIKHYRQFSKDRSAKNLLDLTLFMQRPKMEFDKALAKGEPVSADIITEHVQALVTYCYMHNKNLIKKEQKSLHEKYVARNLARIVSNEDHITYLKHPRDTVRSFILNNKQTFNANAVDDQTLSKARTLIKQLEV